MDERSVLLAQIEALLEDLKRADQALDAPQIDSTLRDAVGGLFRWRIEDQQKELDRLLGAIARGLSLAECWCGFRDVRKKCTPIFRECLAFLEGALLRSARLDGHICEVADALLAELSDRTQIPWQRFTILAEDEFFTDMADIIRLRFPEFSIWGLPIAAHEFGHFVAQEMKDTFSRPRRYPFQDFLGTEVDRRDVSFVHEHFADLFAVYALGPAYACTCLLLRFDPRMAHVDKGEHPSDARRVYFILGALDEMDKAKGGMGPSYVGIIETLRPLWLRSLEQLDRTIIAQLDHWLWRLYVMVDKYLPDDVRYAGWSRALELSADLRSNKEPAQLLQSKYTLADVLNAAWLCRMEHWDEGTYEEQKNREQKISKNAVALCRKMIELL